MPATGPVDEVGESAMTGAGIGPHMAGEVALAPEPGAASTARAWVAAALDGWPTHSVETARLLVSELVTNAVLHARTEIALRHRLDGARVRFEVGDGRRDGPMPKRYSPDSPTGRGLRLVDTLAAEWGVTRSPRGKVVWFVVTPESGTSDQLAAQFGSVDLPRRPVSGADQETGDAPAPAVSAGIATVQILGLPLEVFLEAEQHNDAVMRELTLLLQSSTSHRGLEVPARLLELAADARARFGATATAVRRQVERAVQRRQETIDITMDIPPGGSQALLDVSAQLEEVDRFCEEGDLLTLGSPPRVRRFRQWVTQQIGDQVAGLPATPWPAGTPSVPL